MQASSIVTKLTALKECVSNYEESSGEDRERAEYAKIQILGELQELCNAVRKIQLIQNQLAIDGDIQSESPKAYVCIPESSRQLMLDVAIDIQKIVDFF